MNLTDKDAYPVVSAAADAFRCGQDFQRQPGRMPLSTWRLKKWMGGNKIQRGGFFRASRWRRVRVWKSDRESDAGWVHCHLQVTTLSGSTHRDCLCTITSVTPRHHLSSHPPSSQTQLWLQGLTLHNPNIICRRHMDAPLWLGDTGERDGGHTSKHRPSRHSIDLCCHWIQDWLPSQHRCLTVISCTNVENKRYVDSLLSMLRG